MKHTYNLTLVMLCFYALASAKPFISILTHKIGAGEGWYHYAVTKSVYIGMCKLNLYFNFNPASIDEVGEVAVVLTDPTGALAQAIQLKKQGIIKKIVAGPNLVTHAYEYEKIFDAPEIDACVVPSPMMKDVYEEELPSLKGRTYAWPAGVNTEIFAPQHSTVHCKDVIVYWKTESECFCQEVEQLLRAYGFNPVRIRYGSYQVEEYRAKLARAKFAVFISKFESQGIALAESWSMNVPTLVWNPQEAYVINDKYFPLSSAPYLNERVGSFWKTIEDLEKLLQAHAYEAQELSPRAWVLENMSDEASVKCLLKIILTNYQPEGVQMAVTRSYLQCIQKTRGK